jgi:hypothetical protein
MEIQSRHALAAAVRLDDITRARPGRIDLVGATKASEHEVAHMWHRGFSKAIMADVEFEHYAAIAGRRRPAEEGRPCRNSRYDSGQ